MYSAHIELRSQLCSAIVSKLKRLRRHVAGLLPDGYFRGIGAQRFYEDAKIFACHSDSVRELIVQKRDMPEWL